MSASFCAWSRACPPRLMSSPNPCGGSVSMRIRPTHAPAHCWNACAFRKSLWQLAPGDPFSGGEQQRVNIARGFVHPWPALLLDEPTASLDPANRETVLELIMEAKGAAARPSPQGFSTMRMDGRGSATGRSMSGEIHAGKIHAPKGSANDGADTGRNAADRAPRRRGRPVRRRQGCADRRSPQPSGPDSAARAPGHHPPR